jgi:hypothetical protein
MSEPAINPVLDDVFTVRLGAIHNEVDGTITVSREPLPVTPIGLNVLGLDDTDVSPWGSVRWRLGERWALNFHYDRYENSASAEIDDSFNFDGAVYPAGARIESDLTADAYVMDVSYAVFRGRRYEAGLGVGMHAFDLDASLKGTLEVGEIVETLESTDRSFLAPVPNLRAFGTYAFSRNLSVTGSAGWLSASYEDWDGRFLYFRGSVEFRPWARWGLGLGYQYTDINVEHDRGGGDFEKFNGDLRGIQAYLGFSF